MGTWDTGPFNNDAALDFVGEVLEFVTEPLLAFMANPEIDGDFDQAFAAVAMLNGLMAVTDARPDHDGEPLDGEKVRRAMLQCFDDQIDDLEPDPDFKAGHRQQLVASLDTFVHLLSA